MKAPSSTHGKLAGRNTLSLLTVNGSIVSTITGGFTLNAGSSIGYLHVYTTASTAFTGPAPAVGQQNVQVTGTGSTSTSITAASVDTTGGSTTGTASGGSPIPMQSAKVSAAGPITGTSSGVFTINAGSNVGYLHIYTNASTAYAGGKPATGLYAEVTGTGSLATSITAGYVALYTSQPGTVTVSGTAGSATSYGFVQNAPSVTVPVVMNGSTIVGGAPLATGATVKITGIGTATSAILAQQIVVAAPTPAPGTSPTPTPGPIATKHVLTADYLGAPYGSTSVAWSQAAPYLTWAQTNVPNSTAIAATGIKTQFYVDPNREAVGDALYSNDETVYAHDCNNQRVYDTYAGTVQQYVTDPSSPTTQAAFANYVANIASQGHFDALYEDDAGPLSAYAVYTPFSAMPCGYADSAWVTGELALDAAPAIPVIYNGLSGLNGHNPSLALQLLPGANVSGANYEHCYSDNAEPKMTGWEWQAIENTELQVNASHKLFECQLRNLNAAASSTDQRIYAYASFLLTYNPATSIYWSEFATPSGFKVEPETALVPMNPLASAPSDVSGLLQTGGAYGRAFGQCYLGGNFVGPCAVVVNADSQLSHANPFPQYGHTLVLSGGGVLDGGTVATNGPAAPATLAPSEAAILFP